MGRSLTGGPSSPFSPTSPCETGELAPVPRFPHEADNTLLPCPSETPSPNSSFLTSRPRGPTGPGEPGLPGSPFSPGGPKSPCGGGRSEVTGTQVAANSWGVVTPETSRLPKVTGTHRGSCSSGEANGTLQGMEGGYGTHLELSGTTSSPPITPPHPIPHLLTRSPGSPLGPGSPGRTEPGGPWVGKIRSQAARPSPA